MSTNQCREFKLVPPLATPTDVDNNTQVKELLDNMHNATIVLLQEVAKLRDEVNTLRGL